MYLNENLLDKDASSAKRSIIIGAAVSAFFLFGVVEGLLGDEKLMENSPYYILMMLPFLALIYKGIQKRMKIGLCNRLNQAFIADADGVLPISSIQSVTGYSDEAKAEKMINKLISQGYLLYVTLDPDRPHTLLLSGKTSGPKTADTICPYCGAKVEKREGFSVTCPYCRSVIH